MAPALAESPSAAQAFSYDKPSKSVFPDGYKTSGQWPPIYDQLRPYSDFPKEITGQTVWKAEDYTNNPERWTHRFSKEETTQLGEAADAFMASGTPLTGISKEKFPLPKMEGFLTSLRNEILDGKGFLLFKGFPVTEWGNHKSAVAYMGIGCYLGYFVSQNGYGHVLGHVKDVGADASQIDKVRIYRTSARQFFHADDSDIVGLLCVARSLEGGESDIASVHNVWNTIQREHPDVAETLTQPIWYFDRKGEVSVGQEPYTRQPIFYIENGGEERVYCKYDPYFVKSLKRFSDVGVIPPLSEAQEKAIKVLEDTCVRLSLHMILEVGDIQFLSNLSVLHARTAYKDHAPPLPRRHLMRLWLAVPETEGGWKLATPDSKHQKRGGIQVNDTPPKALLDAE
ncbi:hypothetical protein B0A48_03099 [Cryoendolithus antarcticus]|uniref:TauD/TfdA-like domain-containing protein n=1 Tax=Cryoendolithus antarcticus TaxID=1507870 RepID=A0A1V8TM50_9PEZI|nr:hypothetical protein B0A48_03099 [Cryoendolithus antarcticus]